MKKLLIGILSIGCLFLAGCGKEETKPAQENIGSVDKTTVEVLVSFFNDEINENSGLGPITNDTPIVENGNYRYDLEDGVYVTVTPEKQEAKDKDIVTSMQICFSEADETVATAYAKLLVVANNNEITSEEADKLVTDAKSSKDESKNNGKGIFVKYVQNGDHYEYQIIRNNK